MPFENPNGLTNVLEMLAMLAIPAALTFTYGRMVGSRRQGWAIFGVMFALLAIGVAVVYLAELQATPAQQAAGLTGPNLEGKELRFGTAGTALWTAITTATSTGAVNGALESLTGFGGLVPMVNMAFGESVFGGVGTGLYTMLLYVLLAVFIGGLMVGRTPEYLGKKLEAREIKLVVLALLVSPLLVLAATAIATSTDHGQASIYAAGPQGFSESLYAYLSQANNNGSAFAGYTGLTFADVLGGLTMLVGRFVPIVLTLAIAGAMRDQRVVPTGLGTMRTDTPTFAGLTVGTVVIVGALTFLPALLLGPVVQGLTTQLF
jgi:K+-transporting ATPase ATPase A chain